MSSFARVLVRLAVRVIARPLEVHERLPDRAAAIIVLGSPVRPDGSVSRPVEERLNEAVALWQRGLAPLVCLTGGKTRGASIAEAEAMAARLLVMGVPRSALLVEDGSRTTRENALNCAQLLAGGAEVVLVSQPFHLRRSRMWFRRFGMKPRAHWIADSLQYDDAGRAVRWVAREYGAWVYELIQGAVRGR